MVDVTTTEDFTALGNRVSDVEGRLDDVDVEQGEQNERLDALEAGGGGGGTQGPPGLPMDTNNGPPTVPGTQDGQTILNVAPGDGNGDVYGWGTSWNKVGNIRGPKGDPGPPGDTSGGGGGEALAGYRNWDSFGPTENDRCEAVNDYHMNHGGQPLDTIAMPSRIVHHSVPLKLFSGAAFKGSTTAREYSRHAGLYWDGPADSAQFIFPPEGQTGQSYPSDGSPRDITWENIQFLGSPDNHHIEFFDLDANAYQHHTLWYCAWRGCGWSYFKTNWSGWGTGTSVVGTSHIQGNGREGFAVGGSENRIHGGEYGLSDGQQSLHQQGGLPSIQANFGRGLIGDALVSVRGDTYGLLIGYGDNIYVHGLGVDSPNSEPHLGASVKIKGGSNITLSGMSIKGGMHNPDAATGGRADNHGFIDITGGDDITVIGCNVLREGTNAPANTPVVYVGAEANGVLIASVNCSGFDGVVQVEQGADVHVLDPRLTIQQVARSRTRPTRRADDGFREYLDRMREARDRDGSR